MRPTSLIEPSIFRDKPMKVCIVGGTHGNELTGIHLVRHWQQHQLASDYAGLEVEYLLANPQAIAANRRYLEKDLNRCFQTRELADPHAVLTEQQRAKAINQQLGPKGQARIDLIIDLHTSTAAMRTNIVLIRHDAFHLNLAAWLQSELDDVVITSERELMQDHHFLCSIADKGIVIEVGPVPQGALEYPVFNKTQQALAKTLEFVSLWQAGRLIPSADWPSQLTLMSYYDKLYFPLDEQGEICATVHPDLIHQDFSEIQTGQPIFQKFDGETLFWEGDNTFIAFVNEAAYYDQKIAMCLCRPLRVPVPPLSEASNGHD